MGQRRVDRFEKALTPALTVMGWPSDLDNWFSLAPTLNPKDAPAPKALAADSHLALDELFHIMRAPWGLHRRYERQYCCILQEVNTYARYIEDICKFLV